MSIERYPGQGKYAKPEVERRWLIPIAPRDSAPAHTIHDRYVRGTRLRLREMIEGGLVVYKLCQKVRALPEDPNVVSITNIYLSAAEFRVLADLPADSLVKSRRLVIFGGTTFAVDQFEGELEGLILAETEGRPTELPEWLGQEVTHDDRFSGGTLAREGRPS